MVKVIMGLKGSGKTKQLIESINTAIKTESGSMICIEKGNKLTFDIDYRVRLIESSEYQLGSYTFLKGFISGLHAGNFDISHIFIDSLYKIACSEDIKETEDFLAWCEAFANANSMKFTITISADIDSATDAIKKYF
jgi:energy-coupling factor transporter ATP-binding protein EcfA2